MGELRTCKVCHETKPLSDFYPNKTASDGIGNVCRACKRIRDAAYRERNRNKVRDSGRRWYRDNAEKARSISRAYDRALRLEVLTAYGGKCECCGEAATEFLTIDHINGGGSAHRKVIGSKIYRHLKKQGYPSGFRVLCYNCNCSLGMNGYCPHQVVNDGI